MIVTVLAAMMAMQAGADGPRNAYRSCLNNAVSSAKTANVTADGFKDYAHKTCASAADGLKSKLVAFNVKNGMSKKAAADDADIQLDDYLYSYEEKFRYAAQPQ
ncbi:MAG TPA: hypothetical protein VFU80_07860 [Sphingomicrobium sp.]|nr:hypothetical protein [Sphingomicrobium sp.]